MQKDEIHIIGPIFHSSSNRNSTWVEIDKSYVLLPIPENWGKLIARQMCVFLWNVITFGATFILCTCDQNNKRYMVCLLFMNELHTAH
jgi:hypothetical protein